MEDEHVPKELKHSRRPPWNKGKLIGAKPLSDPVMSGR
jgi:hypothetical protein